MEEHELNVKNKYFNYFHCPTCLQHSANDVPQKLFYQNVTITICIKFLVFNYSYLMDCNRMELVSFDWT